MTTDYTMIAIVFTLQGAFAGSMYTQIPSYMNERFPTEVRATAAAFCYHQGAIFGGLVPLALTWFAVDQGLGFALPMMVCASGANLSATSRRCWPGRTPRVRKWSLISNWCRWLTVRVTIEAG